MDNLFLSREVGSIETGPQTFAGTDVLGTTFIFRQEPFSDPPGLLNSVLVQNAGYEILNGTFVYAAPFEDKQYYIKDENPDLFIIWFSNRWEIYNFGFSASSIYFSSEDVLYPWNVTNWSVFNSIYNPPPTVTKVL
jgi:hypothetical protein